MKKVIIIIFGLLLVYVVGYVVLRYNSVIVHTKKPLMDPHFVGVEPFYPPRMNNPRLYDFAAEIYSPIILIEYNVWKIID